MLQSVRIGRQENKSSTFGGFDDNGGWVIASPLKVPTCAAGYAFSIARLALDDAFLETP